jgi:hypothetical protein
MVSSATDTKRRRSTFPTALYKEERRSTEVAGFRAIALGGAPQDVGLRFVAFRLTAKEARSTRIV